MRRRTWRGLVRCEGARFCDARQCHYRNGRVKLHQNNRSTGSEEAFPMRKLLLAAAVAAVTALTAAPAAAQIEIQW